MSIYTHSLALDTNVFKKIIHQGNDHLFENLFLQLNKIVNPQNKYTGFMSTVTPFLLLEYLGQLPPNIEIPRLTKDEVTQYGSGLPREIFNRAALVYEKEPSLEESNLRIRNFENKKRLSLKATKLYDDIVEKIVSKNGFTNFLKLNLALDYSYRYPVQKSLKEEELIKVHINSMLDIYRAHKERNNITQVRGVLKLCEQLKAMNKKQEISEGSKQVFDATKGIKEFRDLADLDLIQIACLGAFIDTKKYPVLILTGDPRDSVINRIVLFKSTFAFFDREIKKLGHLDANPTLEPVSQLEGQIAFVDIESCSITEFIEVSSIPIAV